MFGIFSKSLFGAAAIAFVAAISAGMIGENRTGTTLLVFVSIVLAFVGVVLATNGIREAVLVDAGATSVYEPRHREGVNSSLWPMVGAAGGVAAILSSVFGVVAVAVSMALVAASFAGWFAQSARENSAWNDFLSERARIRLTAPFAVPLASLVGVLFVGICVSRVLLAAPKEGSLVAAGVIAVLFLGGGFVAATVRGKSAAVPGTLFGFAIVGLVIAGIIGVAHGERAYHPETPRGEVAEFDIESAADTNAYNVNRIIVPLATQETPNQTESLLAAGRNGTPFMLKIKNNSAVSHHNMSFYTANPDDGGTAVFQGGWIAPHHSDTYYINPTVYRNTNSGFLDAKADGGAATYFWRCDIHPNMNGYVTVPAITNRTTEETGAHTSVDGDKTSAEAITP